MADGWSARGGGVLVIAEAGVNHNGDPRAAMALIAAAADAGADAVKFQTFVPANLAVAGAPTAEYQRAATGSDEGQVEMLGRLVLPPECYPMLMAECRARNVGFLSTPFDTESLDFLVGCGVEALKLSSGAVVHGPLLLAAARTGLPLILSTGMSAMHEVEAALGVLAFGMEHAEADPPPAPPFAISGRLAERVTLLHCTSEYPCPFESVNLRAMDTLAARFGLPVGYSDHTPGIAVAVAAAARGARVIEKHLTLDRNLPGPDHQASILPSELAAMVAAIRQVEAALGSTEKRPGEGELGVARVARASLVAARAISRGEPFTPGNLAVKRPGTGISPMRYWEYLGRPAARTYRADEPIDE